MGGANQEHSIGEVWIFFWNRTLLYISSLSDYVFSFQGMLYFITHNILEDSVVEVAKFINCSGVLNGKSVREYLNTRYLLFVRLVFTFLCELHVHV